MCVYIYVYVCARRTRVYKMKPKTPPTIYKITTLKSEAFWQLYCKETFSSFASKFIMDAICEFIFGVVAGVTTHVTRFLHPRDFPKGLIELWEKHVTVQ